MLLKVGKTSVQPTLHIVSAPAHHYYIKRNANGTQNMDCTLAI